MNEVLCIYLYNDHHRAFCSPLVDHGDVHAPGHCGFMPGCGNRQCSGVIQHHWVITRGSRRPGVKLWLQQGSCCESQLWSENQLDVSKLDQVSVGGWFNTSWFCVAVSTGGVKSGRRARPRPQSVYSKQFRLHLKINHFIASITILHYGKIRLLGNVVSFLHLLFLLYSKRICVQPKFK